MLKTYLTLTFSFLILHINAQSIDFKELALIEIFQLDKKDSKQFDLSGIVEVDNKIYIVADKTWNQSIYEINFSSEHFHLTDSVPVVTNDRLDLEAIDFCSPYFYLSNEMNGNNYRLAREGGQVEILDIDFLSKGYDNHSWKNAGWEGLAVDCSKQIAYFIKERQPRIIFKVDLETKKILSEFNIPETESNDFSDAKFENGFLYVLERNGNYITKIDIAKEKVVAKVCYKHIASHEEGKLYIDEKYGMAEALLLKEDEIWIGLDNNGHKVSEHAIKNYGIQGNSPVIIKFKRPIGF